MTFGSQGLFGFLTAGEGAHCNLVSSGRVFLTSHNSQDCPTAKNDPAQNANSSEVEKPSSTS